VSGARYRVATYAVSVKIGDTTINGLDVVANDRTNEIIVGRDILNEFILTLNGLANVTIFSNTP
jgi:hypothetical protein